jgi:hypothetical protein
MKALKRKRSSKPIAKKKAATKAKVVKSKAKKSSAVKKPSTKGAKPPIGIFVSMRSGEGQWAHDAFVNVLLPVTPSIYKPIEKLFGLDWKKEFAIYHNITLQKPHTGNSDLDYWAPLFIMGVGYEGGGSYASVYAIKWGLNVFVLGSGILIQRDKISIGWATAVDGQSENEEEKEPVPDISFRVDMDTVRVIKSAIAQWNTLFEHKMDDEGEELNLKGERSVVLKTFEKLDEDNCHVWTKNWDDSDCLNGFTGHWGLTFNPGYFFSD